MAEKVLVGKGGHFEEIHGDSWEEKVAIESQHIPAVLDFMTKDHHLIRNLVVEDIARAEKPISAGAISEKLDMPHSKVIAILDDLERNLFFLVRNSRHDVSWAFPVTAETTPHKLTFNTGERPHAAWAVDAIATPFVQGRLRKEAISVTIDTVCAHCNQPFTIILDSNMNFRISPEDAEPLIFSPQVDWASFSDPNIIQAFWKQSVFFRSEEHARDHKAKTEQVDGILLTMDQAIYSIPMIQSALFAFK